MKEEEKQELEQELKDFINSFFSPFVLLWFGLIFMFLWVMNKSTVLNNPLITNTFGLLSLILCSFWTTNVFYHSNSLKIKRLEKLIKAQKSAVKK